MNMFMYMLACIKLSNVSLTLESFMYASILTRTNIIGPNCPGISGTVTDFFGQSRIPDSFIIVPEVEERRTIRPLLRKCLHR